MNRRSVAPFLAGIAVALLAPSLALADTDKGGRWTVLVNETAVGQLEVAQQGPSFTVDYEYRNNGRGPTLRETLTVDESGLPESWTVDGNTTFGNAVAERYQLEDGMARWTDSTGEGEASVREPMLYVPQHGSPFALWVLAQPLLADLDMSLPALPGGNLHLTELQEVEVTDDADAHTVRAFALSGTELEPVYFLLDGDAGFFGLFTPRFQVLREGFEGNAAALGDLAADLAANHWADIGARVAHDYDRPVRVANVRVFDPATLALTAPSDVLVEGDRIVAVVKTGASPTGDEVVIDGGGGTLLPGLWDMHAHMDQQDALLNIAAGVTAMRDMGNDNEVLAELVGRIGRGEVAGPRVVRSGIIEGRSPYSSNGGVVVDSEAEALVWVDRYADQGFWQIKIYNSMQGEWVPALVERAHQRGLRVAGHVPAFAWANDMIIGGYDEMTHINQVMLGWVLEDGEDTRTLLRLTALKRLEDLDLDSEAVQETIALMVENGTAIDPTLAIHEALLLGRNGEVRAGAVDWIDHMPVGVQRDAKVAWADIATEADDIAYRAAWDRIIDTIRRMREAGIFIVFGTDMGGAFNLHRELELYEMAGFTRGEVLKRATLDMAEYTGQGQELGSIEAGKLADFFLVPGDPLQDLKALKTVSLVVAGGRVYFPTEIYREVGIRPFTERPPVSP